ncbi:hypothetical protein N7478_008191 [Penicillium angulare]|uniref:uncharacterized protein n=1 Tax=Penicillium angulare TaxID=116970 RepID=UPI00253F7CF0|nr:uncharacterized protein N7478_008191 [Penicillium angulare]KAJ5273066.1 hypothetical protein N7478_008191 [Penicillium angulare]
MTPLQLQSTPSPLSSRLRSYPSISPLLLVLARFLHDATLITTLVTLKTYTVEINLKVTVLSKNTRHLRSSTKVGSKVTFTVVSKVASKRDHGKAIRRVSGSSKKSQQNHTRLTKVISVFLKDEYSDMKIVCGDKTFPAHKLVVCRRSTWFKVACGSGFKESSGEINLTDKDPILVQKILEYLYNSDYSLKKVAMDLCTPVNENSPSVNQFGLRKRKLSTTASTKTTASPKEPPRKRTRSTLELPGDSIKVNLTHERQPSETRTPQTSDSSLSQIIEKPAEDWPPLNTCPPSYFHARIFAEADFFLLDDLKEQAKDKFDESLRACTVVWKLELLILELWSARADYKELRSIILCRIGFSGTNLNKLFLQLDRSFIESVPGFATDFCWERMKDEREKRDGDNKQTPERRRYMI